MDQTPFLLALQSVNGLGPIRLKKLLDHFKSPQKIWEAQSLDLKQVGLPQSVLENLTKTIKNENPYQSYEKVIKSGIKVMSLFDYTYPENLKQIYDPPYILFYKGTLPDPQKTNVAVVGTRKMTGYGKTATQQLVSQLVKNDIVIVSGLARGVDTIAHAITVAEGGKTIAVLGGGLNKLFPPENIHLANQIMEKGGVVMGEYHPDLSPLPGNFPARNRIIAGLSQGVLVTEAAIKSGSMITARLAADMGREVFSVPGPIYSEQSLGTLELIKQGAKVVTDVKDILEELGLETVITPEQIANSLSNQELAVLESLNQPKSVDELVLELNILPATLFSSLSQLEVKGFIKNLGQGIYIRS